jgi:hypothetical protein
MDNDRTVGAKHSLGLELNGLRSGLEVRKMRLLYGQRLSTKCGNDWDLSGFARRQRQRCVLLAEEDWPCYAASRWLVQWPRMIVQRLSGNVAPMGPSFRGRPRSVGRQACCPIGQRQRSYVCRFFRN